MCKQYRHYGALEFSKDIFEPVKNRPHWIKPFGGLWGTPLPETSSGWAQVCRDNEFRVRSLHQWFDFSLSDDAKVYTIANGTDILKLKDMGCCGVSHNTSTYIFDLQVDWIDFEGLIILGYDAVECKLNHETYWALYGWDCDSILVLNPDVIESLAK